MYNQLNLIVQGPAPASVGPGHKPSISQPSDGGRLETGTGRRDWT